MSLVTSVLVLRAAVEGANVLPFPPVVFALIAAAVFLALGFVVWSYRDVANRHSDKVRRAAGRGSDDH